MLNQFIRMGKISGVPISQGGIKINHLLFADDNLLFGRANLREWRQIKDILDIYERALRQKVNLEKTTLFFSRNTREEDWGLILLNSMRHTWGYQLLLVNPESLLSTILRAGFGAA
jgi:hypothetical protein